MNNTDISEEHGPPLSENIPNLILYHMFSWLDVGYAVLLLEWRILLNAPQREGPNVSAIIANDNFSHLLRWYLPGFLTNHCFKEEISYGLKTLILHSEVYKCNIIPKMPFFSEVDKQVHSR